MQVVSTNAWRIDATTVLVINSRCLGSICSGPVAGAARHGGVAQDGVAVQVGSRACICLRIASFVAVSVWPQTRASCGRTSGGKLFSYLRQVRWLLGSRRGPLQRTRCARRAVVSGWTDRTPTGGTDLRASKATRDFHSQVGLRGAGGPGRPFWRYTNHHRTARSCSAGWRMAWS